MRPFEKIQCAISVVLALTGAVLMTVRPWGMRFSGFLLVGLAAVLIVALLLDRWASVSKTGRLCRRIFQTALTLVLVPLICIEVYVINVGRSDLSALPADAVVVLGAGVNGTQPSLSLYTRLTAALDYLEENPDIPVVLTGGRGYGEEITEAQCMYDWLTARGVDPARLILEEQAGVTNDFHIARSRLIAARQGYGHVFGVPAELPWLHLEVNYYLREAFAMVKTWIFD